MTSMIGLYMAHTVAYIMTRVVAVYIAHIVACTMTRMIALYVAFCSVFYNGYDKYLYGSYYSPY
jgi:hypothetical protein